MNKYPLTMALLCSSQNQAYLEIKLNGQAIDYRFIVVYEHKSHTDQESIAELHIHHITYEDQGPHKPEKAVIAKDPHKAIIFNDLKAMLEFLTEQGLKVDDMWLPVENMEEVE